MLAGRYRDSLEYSAAKIIKSNNYYNNYHNDDEDNKKVPATIEKNIILISKLNLGNTITVLNSRVVSLVR